MQPDLQEPLAGVEPLQDGPVEHGGGPAGQLRERRLHVGGAPQRGVMHEEGHAVQAARGRATESLPTQAPLLSPVTTQHTPPGPHPHTPTRQGALQALPLSASGSPSAQGRQWAGGRLLQVLHEGQRGVGWGLRREGRA